MTSLFIQKFAVAILLFSALFAFTTVMFREQWAGIWERLYLAFVAAVATPAIIASVVVIVDLAFKAIKFLFS